MNINWRLHAKIVAYVDLIMTSLSLILFLGMAFSVGVYTSEVNEDLHKRHRNISTDPDQDPKIIPQKEAEEKGVWLLWLAVIIIAAYTILQLWAAIKLVKATEMGKEPTEALEMAATWRKISIIFLGIQIVSNLIIGAISILFMIAILIRASCIYTVWKFMKVLVQSCSLPEDPESKK